MKREPGENPGQSRCCEFRKNVHAKPLPLETSGKAHATETSQKTCHDVSL